MPSTWELWSKEVYGEVREQSPVRERYVVTRIVSRWVEEGLSNSRVFLRYNAGNASKCSKGVNSLGVEYDSCAYVAEGINHLAMR